MVEKEFTINNTSGLHARPAALFVKTAKQFQSEITVSQGSKSVNAKSLIHILTLGAEKGSIINVKVDGSDEDEVIPALEKIMTSDEFMEILI